MKTIGIFTEQFGVTASESGQALPLFSVLLALFSILGIGVTNSLRSHTIHFVDREKRVQNEMQKRSIEILALNEITNNNIRIRDLIREMLLLYESSLSRSFNLSSSTPLWEQSLPIPIPYNVFHKLDVSIPALLSDVAAIEETNSILLQKLHINQRQALSHLSFTESICAFTCINPDRKLISGSRCQAVQSVESECSILISGAFLSPPSFKSISIHAIIPEKSSTLKGFISFNLEELIFNKKIPSTANGKRHIEQKDDLTVTVVHPRLCKFPRISSLLPCAPKVENRKIGNRLSESVLFEPHWSIAVED